MSSGTNNAVASSFHQAEDVCRALFEDTWLFTIKLIKLDDEGQVEDVTYSYGNLALQVKQFPTWREERRQPFMMVGMTDGEGIGARNVNGTWAIAVDFDQDVDMSLWIDAPFRPTIAINTSGKRQHMLWILKGPIDSDTHRLAARALAYRLGGDMCFAHEAQAVRLPGFVNEKHGTPVKLSLFSNERAYDYPRLAVAFDFDLVVATLQANVPMISKSLKVDAISDEDKQKRLGHLKDALRHIPSDEYSVWFKVLAALRTLGPDGEGIAKDWSSKSTNYDEAEFRRKWEDVEKITSLNVASIFFLAERNGWRNPGRDTPKVSTREPLTERILGRMLASAMHKDIAVARLGHGDKQTLQALKWDGCKYGAIDQFAFRQCLEGYCKNLTADGDDDAKRALLAALSKHTGDVRLLDSLGRSALEFLLSSCDSLYATRYPYFPVANGILNLLSGQLVPDQIRAISHRHSQVAFDPSARAPRFNQFLAEIFEDDEDVIKFFLRLIGCILLGKPVDHIFVIFHGPKGRNGKSVLVEVLMAIFGAFSSSVAVATITAKHMTTDGPTTALARLEGKRLVVISEPNDKQKLDAGLVKQLTGGDRITARPLYGNEVEFLPEFTPIMVTNFIPKIHAADEALWARIKIIRFMRTFSPEEIDLGLKDKLLAELPGILNMLLCGTADYLENGLQAPSKVHSAGQEQRKLADGFEAWLEERTLRFEGEIQFKPLHEDYAAWAKLNPEFDRLSQTEFKTKLGVQFTSRLHRHNRLFSGITLKELD
ncbi:phage/plasmid primase, P4 family [Bordetella sp. LUAb4]|uniref:phage/plasmid primase, P4 family n=1 Tax=Bordetella sp. LUAb4 TaxID=2843195 RepID=UPI001E2888AB|nr:phage/plasmid primase, P4 family [Bordetella sp. LUAb4]